MTNTLKFVAVALVAIAACPSFTASAQQTPDTPDVGKLAEDLASSDRDARRDAAYALSMIGHDAAPALPALIEALKDEDHQVWAFSNEAVANIGPDAADAIPTLIGLIDGSDSGASDEGRRRRRFGADDQRFYRTAYSLGEIGAAAVEPVSGLLDSRSSQVRGAGAQALAFAGPDAAPATDRLIELLDDNDERVRRVAGEALGRIGPAAVTKLAAALASPTPRIAIGAAEALVYMGANARPAQQALLDAATHRDEPEIRAAAINALGALRSDSDELLGVFLSALDDENEALRAAAVEAFLATPRAIQRSSDQLITRLDSQDLALRNTAAYLLGSLRPASDEVVAALIDHLRPGEAELAPVAIALGQIGPAVVPPLLEKAKSGGVDVEALQLAVETVGTLATSALLDSLASDHVGSRLAAARALAGIRSTDPRLPERLGVALSDVEPAVRAASAVALGGLGDTASGQFDALATATTDDDATVRAASVTAIASIGVEIDRIAPVLVTALSDEQAAVRARAAEAISSLESPIPAAVPVLTGALDDEDTDVRLNAIEALASMGAESAPAVDRLIEALRSPSQPIRGAAARALGAIGSPAADHSVPALAALLSDTTLAIRVDAIQALGAFGAGASPASQVLMEATTDENATVREHAVAAVATVVTDKQVLVPALVDRLHDDAWMVRQASTLALAEMGPDAAPAVSRLFELLDSFEDRDSARTALRKIDAATPDALGAVLAAYRSDDRFNQYMAIRYLGLLGPAAKEALPELREAAENTPNRRMRALIQSTIDKIDVPEPEPVETVSEAAAEEDG